MNKNKNDLNFSDKFSFEGFDTENLPELDSKTSGSNYQQTEYGPYNKEKSEKIKSK